MSDFAHPFWPWFIGVITIAGILAMVWLIRWMSTPPDTQAPGTTGHVWDGDLTELNNPLPRWWLNLFYITLVFGAVYLILYPGLGAWSGVLGWTDTGQYEREQEAATARYAPLFDQYSARPIVELIDDPAAVKVGQRLFAAYCTTCHGSDAGGVRGFPNLRDSDWLWGGTPEAIETTILNGREGVMPPWGAALTDQQIFDVAEYVRHLSGRRADATIVQRGQQVYQQICVACHGESGTGNQALGSPNLTDNIWLYGGSQARLVETVRNGRHGRMPAHGEFLGSAKVHLLATYIYSLSASDQPQ
jgi:cytochrome c oxidase cbb3-type subunit 3